jgi:hypothetical protein
LIDPRLLLSGRAKNPDTWVAERVATREGIGLFRGSEYTCETIHDADIDMLPLL